MSQQQEIAIAINRIVPLSEFVLDATDNLFFDHGKLQKLLDLPPELRPFFMSAPLFWDRLVELHHFEEKASREKWETAEEFVRRTHSQVLQCKKRKQ